MDAIVLVGGQGMRLRPLTATRHKSLVPVCNRPAIAYLFDWLRASNIERVVLALGQGNDDLADAYPEGIYEGLNLVHVRERQRLESGGAIRNAVDVASIEGAFLVLNGDVYMDFPFARALDHHRAGEAELTLALTHVDDPSPFGVAVLDDDAQVVGFVEKPPEGAAPSKLVNAGAWIFEPGLVDDIPAGPVRVEDTLFPSLVAQRRKVLGFEFDGLWADIGTRDRYLQLNLALLEDGATTWCGDGAEIASDASIDRAVIGAGARVGPGAVIRGSVLWERANIGAGATVEGSILADGCEVGAGAVVRDATLGSGAIVPAGVSVEAGTVLEPGTRYHAADGS